MYYVHLKSLQTVSRIEEDGTLETVGGGSIPVKAGEFKITDEFGNSDVISESRFKQYYIPVQRVKEKPVKKQLSPFEELYAQQIAEFNGTLKQDESDLHIKDELIIDKAF